MTEALVSPAARADLIAQCQFFAEEVGDPALANRFAASAERTFKTLARTPGLGRVRSFTDRRAVNLRSWRVDDFPNYLVFYRSLPANRGVEIVRIFHGARDLDALFGE